MLSPFLVLSPSHRCDAQLAIASARSGETGILHLGLPGEDWSRQQSALRILARQAPCGSSWGVLLDVRSEFFRARRKELFGDISCPIIILAGIEQTAGLREAVKEARQFTSCVLVEVYNLAGAHTAQEAGCDGLLVKGHEAGGWVSDESTFLLLQRLHQNVTIPYWVQGGLGPDTAAAAFLSGAAGVVLCEQVWLAVESSFTVEERRLWGQLDGSETVCVQEEGASYRSFNRKDGGRPTCLAGPGDCLRTHSG